MAFGLVCALHHARASGQGSVVDAAMLHGTNHLATFIYGRMSEGSWSEQRESNTLDGGAPFYRVYPCADGGWMAVAAVERQFWRNAVETLGLDVAMVDRQWDRSDWTMQIQAVADRFVSRGRDAWIEAFEGIDACVTPVLSVSEAAAHPQVARFFETVGGVSRPLPAPLLKEADRPQPTTPIGSGE